MLNWIKNNFSTLLLMFIAMMVGILVARTTPTPAPDQPQEANVVNSVLEQQIAQASTATPSGETLPTSTVSPSPQITPSVTNTLLPPPTFEPPTITPFPSPEPSLTPTTEIRIDVEIPGLRGAETPTPSTTPGCTPRADWSLTYEVQRDDALANIAQRYNTNVDELVAGNCLSDANLIRVGQVLRVPGSAQPAVPLVECVPYEIQTPLDGTQNIDPGQILTFNWRGPESYYTVLRITRRDGSIAYEAVVELRQNEIVDLYEDLKEEGIFYWYLFPLDRSFQPVGCTHGGPWSFQKRSAPTETPTVAAIGP